MPKYIPKKIEDISVKWFGSAPFFNEFLLRFSYEKNNEIETMGVGFNKNRKSVKLLFNEDWMNNLTKEELEGILVHEIMHVVGLTKERKENREMTLWNIATDIVNNYEIENSKIDNRELQLPKTDCKIDIIKERFNYNGEIIAEPIYKLLDQEEEKKQGQRSNPNDNEDNNDGTPNNPIDDHGQLEKTIEDHKDNGLLEALNDIVQNAKSREWGNISGNLETKLKELIKPAKLNIYKKIRNKISKQLHKGKSYKSNTWKRRNRRGYPLPGKERYDCELHIFIDTSGSCYDEEIFQKFFSEIDYISEKFKDISLYEFDVEVKADRAIMKYSKGDWKKLSMLGGGGTSVQPIFNYLNNNKLNREAIVILTDGYFDWEVNNYGIKPIWIFVNNNMKASFGESFYIEKE